LEKLVHEALPIMPEQSLPLNNNNFDKSPCVLMSDAIYRVPGHWDFSRLKMIVHSRRAAADDHVRDFQEDPEYFRYTMEEDSQQCVGRLNDIGKVHLDLILRADRQEQTSFGWDSILKEQVAIAYEELRKWALLCDQWTEIDRIHTTCPDFEACIPGTDMNSRHGLPQIDLNVLTQYYTPQGCVLRSSEFAQTRGRTLVFARNLPFRRPT